MTPQPPRFLLWLLRRGCPPEYLEPLEGDLHAQYRRWHARQGPRRAMLRASLEVLLLLRPFVLPRPESAEPFYEKAGGFVMWKNYLTVVLRALRRRKGYTFINISGLAVGIACCLLIFLYVRDERSFDRFHEHADRLYRMTRGAAHAITSTPSNARFAFEETVPEAEHIVRVVDIGRFGAQVVRQEDRIFNESRIYYADPAFFTVFSFPFLRGDPTTALERPNTVVLTQAMAEKYFGPRDPLGQQIQLGNTVLTVTGIVGPPPGNTHLAFDFVGSMGTVRWAQRADWGSGNFRTYMLLRDGASPAAAEAQMAAVVQQAVGEEAEEARFQYHLQPVPAIHLQSDTDALYLYLFAAIAVLILLIACINYMNLATARATRRAREVGLRKVVGARRGQLVAQFYGESALMAGLAVALGLGLAVLLLPVFNGVSGKNLALDAAAWRFVLPALAAIWAIVGLVAGSYPALLLSSFRPALVLKGQAQARGAWLRKGLVVFQFAISVFLIVGTLVVLQQLRFVQTQSLGLDQERVVVLPLHDGQQAQDYRTLAEALTQQPEVRAATIGSGYPGRIRRTFNEANAEGMAEDAYIDPVYILSTDEHAVEALGLTLLVGRGLSPNHVPEAGAHEYVLNEAAVRAAGWQVEEAVGRWFNLYRGSSELRGTVVGVVQDFHFQSLRQEVQPLAFYVNPFQRSYLMVRLHAGDLPGALATLEQTWQAHAPETPFAYSFLDQHFDALYRAEQRMGHLFTVFAGLAILIACLGLFGLAAFAAEQRRKEIGVRKVLGASVPNLVRLLSQDFLLLVAVAFGLGAPVAWLAMSRWLERFAFHIDLGVGVFAIAFLLAVVIAFATVSYQSLRAATANPIQALRYE